MEILQGFYSDLVLGKVDSSDAGYCFKEIEATYATGMKAGVLIDASGVVVPAGSASTAIGVVTDRKLFANGAEMTLAVGDKFPCVVAVRGVTLNQLLVVYSDGTAITDADALVVEKLGLKLTKKVY